MRLQRNGCSHQGTAISDRGHDFIFGFEKLFACLGNQSVVVGNENSWKISSSNHFVTYSSGGRREHPGRRAATTLRHDLQSSTRQYGTRPLSQGCPLVTGDAL